MRCRLFEGRLTIGDVNKSLWRKYKVNVYHDGYVRDRKQNVTIPVDESDFSPSLTPIIVESCYYYTFSVLAMDSVSYKFLWVYNVSCG